MNMISEQINYLRGYITSDENLYDALHEAADTIESLSAKLDELAVRLMAQENLRSGEMAMKGLLDGFGLNSDAIEASSAKLADKERSAEDCGGGLLSLEECIDILKESKRQSDIILQNPTVFYSEEQISGGCKTMKRHSEAYAMAIDCLEKCLKVGENNEP